MPIEVPWWFAAGLVPVSVWFSLRVWPWLTKRWDTDATARRRDTEAAERRQEDRDERRVRAQEQTAQTLEQIGRVLSVMQMQIAMIERHVGMTPREKVERRKAVGGE